MLLNASAPRRSLLLVSSDPELVSTARTAVGLLNLTFHAVRDAIDAANWLAEPHDEPTDCLLVDVATPGTGLDGLRRKTSAPIIAVTAPCDVPTAVAAMRQGAVHVVEKPVSPTALTDPVQEAVRLAREQRIKEERLSKARRALAELPANHRAVLDRVMNGRSNKSIAVELGVSLRSVELWRSRMMKSLATETLADLIRLVLMLEDGLGE